MDWIDDANRLLREQQEREQEISEHETGIFDALWEELKRHLEAARLTFPGLFTNGQPQSRVVSLPVPPIPPAMESLPRKLHVSLSRDEHQIKAVIVHPAGFGKSASLVFDIDFNRDRMVHLALGGIEIPYKDAAIYTLRPFLYPELPALPPYKEPAWVYLSP